LNEQYTIDDLENKEDELINSISSVYSNSDINYKNEIIQFIKNGKQILYGTAKQSRNNNSNRKGKSDENDTIDRVTNHKIKSSTPSTIQESLDANIINRSDIPNNLGKKYNNVGKIINPMTNHPSLQTQSIPSTTANGYNIHTKKTNYIFNTRFRDNYFGTVSSNCSFTIPSTIKNVISISLSGIQIPNVSSTFSKNKETDQIYIYEDTTELNAIVEIPKGNYSINAFASTLEKSINEQVLGSNPNRFTVTINQHTNTLNIINSTYTFRINIIKKKSSVDNIYNCDTFNYNYELNINIDNIDNKKKIKPSDYFSTMGYLMGFREIEYFGEKLYTTEAPFDDSLQDYYYFELNDYNDYQNDSNNGVFPTYMLSQDIIAVLPITTAKYVSSFDNNANFVYKTREYNSPVDIRKISIKMLSDQGGLVDLHSVDFSFILEVKIIYDNLMPYNKKDVIIDKN
jgi:hypothetical protein